MSIPRAGSYKPTGGHAISDDTSAKSLSSMLVARLRERLLELPVVQDGDSAIELNTAWYNISQG